MKLSLPRPELAQYVRQQFDHFFPDGAQLADLPKVLEIALERAEFCFSRVRLKGYFDKDGPTFNHRHTDQYAIFLYYLSNAAFKAGDLPLAEKAYALNKALHAVDIFYEVQLPAIFALQHPIGTTLGRATYGDYFLCYHNCTVGANLQNEYPSFGRGVVMYSGSRIMGRSKVGDNTLIAPGTIVLDRPQLPANSVLHGIYPGDVASPTKHDVVREIFGMAAS